MNNQYEDILEVISEGWVEHLPAEQVMQKCEVLGYSKPTREEVIHQYEKLDDTLTNFMQRGGM